MKLLFSHKLFFLLEAVLFYALLQFFVVFLPFIGRHPTNLLVIGLGYILLVIKNLGLTKDQLGLTFKNSRNALSRIILPTIIFIGLLLLVTYLYPAIFNIPLMRVGTLPLFWVIIRYMLITAPLQEFAFRGFYLSRLELVSHNKFFLTIFTSFLFMLCHMQFHSYFFTLGSLLLSLWYSAFFLRYRDLLSVTLSHSLIGAAFIYLIYAL